jgi:hypothetical protein
MKRSRKGEQQRQRFPAAHPSPRSEGPPVPLPPPHRFLAQPLRRLPHGTAEITAEIAPVSLHSPSPRKYHLISRRPHPNLEESLPSQGAGY